MSLAEHDAMLKATGQYDAMVERNRQQEAQRQARATEWRRAEMPLVQDLNAAGFAVASVWELVNSSQRYPHALPILVEHLQRSYPSRVREGIARALAVPESKFAWDVLTRLYREEGESDAKLGLAAAISVAADNEVMDDVIDLLREKRHGSSRILLLRALDRSKSPGSHAALEELRSDPELAKEINAILRKRRGR